jgi:hypothetical protein
MSIAIQSQHAPLAITAPNPTSTDKAGSVDLQLSASVLPTPGFSGDAALDLARLMIKVGQQQRSSSTAERRVEMTNMKAAQDQQLSELHKEADEKLGAATEEAVGQIAEGALTAGTAVCSEIKDQAYVANPGIGWRIASDINVGKGTGEVIHGAFSLDAATKNHAASEANIRAKADENLATACKMKLDDLDDAKKAAQTLVEHGFDYLKSLQETTAQTTMSAIKA